MHLRSLLGSREAYLVIGLLAFTAFVMTGFAIADVYPPGDVQITRAIQAIDPPVIEPFLEAADWALYWSGASPVMQLLFVVLATALLLLRHRLLAVFVLVGLAAHNVVFLLKLLAERPRPSELLVDVARTSDGFSFPSGHTMGAVLLWGLVILIAGETIQRNSVRLAIQCFSLVMMALMGIQRVTAGAHWPTDVLASYLWGGLILFGLAHLFWLCRDGRMPRFVAELVASVPRVGKR